MPEKLDICSIDDIPDNQAKGFTLEIASNEYEFFIVRRKNKLYGYINRCPHTGVNLDWTPDQFLDIGKEYIQCSTHGAKFRIKDGYCIYGPCAGSSLTKINIQVINGRLIYINN